MKPKSDKSEIRLRALEPEDLTWLVLIENDPAHWATSDRDLPLSRDVLRRYLEHASETLAEAGQFRWVIERVKDKKTVGLIDLFDYHIRDQRAAVGILIAPEHRRSGYGAKALKQMEDYARNVLLLHLLYARIPAENKASLALFRASGYVETGRFREWLRTPASREDVVHMQIVL